MTLAVLSAGCETREVGNAPTTGGELIHTDDFESATLGDHWERGTGEGGAGKWQIVDGELRGSKLRNDPLWFTRPLPSGVRVEFDARALTKVGDLKVEIFGDGDNHASGYVLIFGGWNNSLDVIARLDEHGDDREERASVGVETNRTYRMAVERRDSTVRWFVDGEPFMTYRDSAPLQGSDHSYFAFSNWDAEVAFDNFRVYKLR